MVFAVALSRALNQVAGAALVCVLLSWSLSKVDFEVVEVGRSPGVMWEPFGDVGGLLRKLGRGTKGV
jgi:hypothetical protein